MKRRVIGIVLSLTMAISLIAASVVTTYAEPLYYDQYEDDWDDWDDSVWEEPDEPEVAPIEKVTVSNIKYNSAKLKWTNPGNVDGYDIYQEIYKLNGDEFQYVLLETIDNPENCTYNLKKLLPCEYYCFYVVPFKYIAGEKVSADMFGGDVGDFMTKWCNDGSFYTSNEKLAKSLTKVFKAYKENAKFKGKGECYGYAEWGSKKIAKTREQVKINKKMTLKNVNKYIVGLKSGAHVRFYSKNVSHSVLIFKAAKKRMYWADNNWGYNNRVHYHAGTPEDFYRQYAGYSKIQWIIKTKKYK